MNRNYFIPKNISLRKREMSILVCNINTNEKFFLNGISKEIILKIAANKIEELIEFHNESEWFNEAIKELIDKGIIEQCYGSRAYVNYIFSDYNGNNINKATLILSDLCNFKCIHCYNDGFYTRKKELTEQQWKNVIDQLGYMGCNIVSVTGGEPFLYKNIFDILKYLNDRGFYFNLVTNGSLINDDIINRLSSFEYLTSIRITLYGLKPETYLNVTKSYQNPQNIITVTHKLKNKGINTSLQYCFMKENFNDAMNLYEFELQNQIEVSKVYNPLFPKLNKDSVEKHNLDMNELRILNSQKNIIFTTDNDPLKICGHERCSIDFQGSVSMCELSQKKSLGNVNENLLSEIWIGKECKDFFQGYKQAVECDKCSDKSFCLKCKGRAVLEDINPKDKIESCCKYANNIKKLLLDKSVL